MIAYRMLYAVAVGVPVVLAAHVVAGALRRHGRAERGVWAAGLVLALVLPAVLMTRPMDRVRSGSPGPADTPGASADATDEGPSQTLLFPTFVIERPAGSPSPLDRWLILGWALASLGLAVRWAVSTRRLRKISSEWRADSWDGSRVWLTSRHGPAVTGALRPRILVPEWLQSLPARQRSLVLLHEHEHVRARDPWLMTVSRLARIATPWNPAVWMMTSRLLQAVETDCDRRVLRRHPDVRAYCDTLLAISARQPDRLVGAAAFTEPRLPLQQRILAMTTPSRSFSVATVMGLLALGVLLIVGSCGMPVPTEREASQQVSVVENPDWLQIVVAPDGSVALDGEAHAMSQVADLVAERVAESPEPLVASIRVTQDVPYRFVDELQKALVAARAIRIVFHVDGAVGAPDGGDGLPIVLPDWDQQMQVVSQRNVLKLHVLAGGLIEVHKGEAVQVLQLRADQVTGLWRQEAIANPNLIAVLSAAEDASYTEVMPVLDALYVANATRIALLGVTAS